MVTTAKKKKKLPTDHRYAINAAKTDLREGYNTADVNRILSVYADAFTDFSAGQPSFYRTDSKIALRRRLEQLFREFQVAFAPIVNNIQLAGDTAIANGWHSLTLRPKNGGPENVRRTRYVEIWNRHSLHGWQIVLFIDNADDLREIIPDPFGEETK